jgi:hypothetical protein
VLLKPYVIFFCLLVVIGHQTAGVPANSLCVGAVQDFAAKPVEVSVMTPRQSVSGFNGSIEGCQWRGRPLGCLFGFATDDPGIAQRAGAWHGGVLVHHATQFGKCATPIPLSALLSVTWNVTLMLMCEHEKVAVWLLSRSTGTDRAYESVEGEG